MIDGWVKAGYCKIVDDKPKPPKVQAQAVDEPSFMRSVESPKKRKA